MSIPVPSMSVREAHQRAQAALEEVRKITRQLGAELLKLEVYAREEAGNVAAEPDARAAYRDMANRIEILRGAEK